MIKFNKLTQAIGTTILLASSSVAMAEIVSVPATVSVNNAIDFTFTGSLDFGEIRATPDSTDDTCAILSMPANPAQPLASVTPGAGELCTTGVGTAVIQSVGGTPARPEFAIAGVAPFTTMTLTLPSDITLTAALPPGSANFSVGNFTAWRTSGTPGAITTTIQTTGTGDATFTVGADIATHVDDGATVWAYEDGIPYTGSFDVEVTY